MSRFEFYATMTKVTIEYFSRIGAIATLATAIGSEPFDRSF
jgi:hypothetical protein